MKKKKHLSQGRAIMKCFCHEPRHCCARGVGSGVAAQGVGDLGAFVEARSAKRVPQKKKKTTRLDN